jgi:hypothetical protein
MICNMYKSDIVYRECRLAVNNTSSIITFTFSPTPTHTFSRYPPPVLGAIPSELESIFDIDEFYERVFP